jgi:hypothetical protein
MWAYMSTPHLATNVAANAIGSAFHTALHEANSVIERRASRRTWKNRDLSGIELEIHNENPEVTMYCIPYRISTFEADLLTSSFVYGDALYDTSLACRMPPSKSSQITTTWLSFNTTGIDVLAEYSPFVNIRIPSSGRRSNDSSLTCGLRASWCKGLILSTTRGQELNVFTHQIDNPDDLEDLLSEHEVTFGRDW